MGQPKNSRTGTWMAGHFILPDGPVFVFSSEIAALRCAAGRGYDIRFVQYGHDLHSGDKFEPKEGDAE